MDWTLAITRNRTALLRLVAALFALAGMQAGGPLPTTLPRHVRRAILKVLRPAESATRRLIVIAALVLGEMTINSAQVSRAFPAGGIPRGERRSTPQFALFDPRIECAELSDRPRRTRKARGPGPRISSFDDESWTAYEQAMLSDDDEVNAAPLCGRLQALFDALSDIPKQARRLARAKARRKNAPPGPKRVGPLRGGWPPGRRKRHIHEVDDILDDCHLLTLIQPKPPDLSLDMFRATA